MKVADALPILSAACNRPFGQLFKNHPEDLTTNKGNVGQLLLKYIGLNLDSNLLDFEDGELKTNKATASGIPAETMFITQISNTFDTLVGDNRTSFKNSNLFLKIRNLVYLPVVKNADNPSDWYFTKCIHIHVEENSKLFDKLKLDYDLICEGLKHHIEKGADKLIHTTNGQHYIQTRTKDSKPYHPIYSKHYGRYISDKNFAFYFKKEFMIDASRGALG